jgi:ABC-type glycerol-3-phosphate transport system substrate-binding protein
MQLYFIRKLFLTCIAFFLVVNCASCAKQADQPTFVIGVWKGQEAEIIEELVSKYPGDFASDIKIEVVSEDSFRDRLWGYLLSQSPEWDLALARSDWVPRWAEYNAIRPMDGPNMITLPGRSDFSCHDQIYGLPLSEDLPILWMRGDLLEPYYGTFMPTTWEEIYAAAGSLSKPPERFGLAIALDRNEVGETLMQMYFGFGGEIDPANSIPHFNSQAGSQALDLIKMLISQGLTAPEDTRSDQILGLMQEGKAGMGVLWLSESGLLFDCEQSPNLCVEGHPVLAGVPLPQEKDVLAHPFMRRSTGLILPGGADYPQEAMDFIQWLSTPDGQFALEEARLQGTERMANEYILGDIEPGAAVSYSSLSFSERFENYLNEAIYESIIEEKEPGVALEEIDIFLNEDGYRNSRRP